MKRRTGFLKASALILAAVVLAGCGTRHPRHPHPPHHQQAMPKLGPLNVFQLGLLRQDRDLNGVLDQYQKIQGVKSCSTGACVIDVAVAATVPPAPGVPFDCELSLKDAADTRKNADILILKRDATQITWNLVPPAGSKIEFRFRKQSLPGTVGNGITLYADPDQRAFAIDVPKPGQVDAKRLVRSVNLGFAYGVYVEWRASDKDAFSDCNPLDPIIIEHD